MSWPSVNKDLPYPTNDQEPNLGYLHQQPAYGLNWTTYQRDTIHGHQFLHLSMPSNQPNGPSPISNTRQGLGPYSAPCCLVGDPKEVPDVPDTCFNYITELLRDDNPEDQPLGTLQDYMAYQAYYQSFTDTLSGTNPHPLPSQPEDSSNQFPTLPPSSDHCIQQCIQQDNFSDFVGSSHGSNSFGAAEDFFIESESNLSKPCQLESSLAHFPLLRQALLSSTLPNSSASCMTTLLQPNLDSLDPDPQKLIQEIHQNVFLEVEKTIGKRHLHSKEGSGDEERSYKKNLTACPETYDQISEYEEDLFCPEGKYDKPSPCNGNGSPQIADDKLEKNKGNPKGSTGRGKSKKQGSRRRKSEVVDLMSLLIICAESVGRMDITNARDQIKLIRQHSSPYGDSIQRVSHYFANSLEQRLSGGVNTAYNQISATEYLKANRIYVAAAPFKIMSFYVANKTIARLAENATTIHIIDFGISYGLQWPCIIYNLSKIEPSPPRIRITGIDFPERGFRPVQRLEETGRCLKRYSSRFNVQFEYKAIVATSWESINVEEIEIRRDEFTVVNCLYRSHQLFDESVEESSPRDAFLELVKKIKPEYFIHGVINGTLNAPFFAMRFKEALSHYAAYFEVFEATMPREDQERALLEEKVFGEKMKNVIACEGKERVERPETYRRWQVRQRRAGFRQVELEKELLRRAKAMVEKSFKKDFMLEEDYGWAVQGWKGRILYAISCWKPEY